ncbi:hypothetical protein EVAR_22279_1 [Eumeta japonica]|uniref:Uncharacterized protein n=1 Tax=Eumeta variegata TaxID=151549 RepID=A0A4C1UBB3_EUMVA|nr:hypothetical protein EVAR_22279_1 [Eumeta japonica]
MDAKRKKAMPTRTCKAIDTHGRQDSWRVRDIAISFLPLMIDASPFCAIPSRAQSIDSYVAARAVGQSKMRLAELLLSRSAHE